MYAYLHCFLLIFSSRVSFPAQIYIIIIIHIDDPTIKGQCIIIYILNIVITIKFKTLFIVF